MVFDVDGVVIELQTMAAVNLHKPHVNLPVLRAANTKDHYGLLKWHLPLPPMRKEGRKALQCMRGKAVGQTTGGYFLNLSLVTSNPKSSWQALNFWVVQA